MKKRVISMVIAACILLTGCGNHAKGTAGQNGDAARDAMENGDSCTENEGKISFDRMNEIIGEIGLENAAGYGEGAEDDTADQILLLCESPSGRYKAYGFISSEYGRQGILIDNVIDGESNHNYFYEKWAYSPEQPSLRESADFYQVVFTICQDEGAGMREIHFTTYDTGTMCAEEWEEL